MCLKFPKSGKIPHSPLCPQKKGKNWDGVVSWCGVLFQVQTKCRQMALLGVKQKGFRFLGSLDFTVVPKAGLEPARICIRQILSHIFRISISLHIFCKALKASAIKAFHISIFSINFVLFYNFCRCGSTVAVHLKPTSSDFFVSGIYPIAHFLNVFFFHVCICIKCNLYIAVPQLILNILEIKLMG